MYFTIHFFMQMPFGTIFQNYSCRASPFPYRNENETVSMEA